MKTIALLSLVMLAGCGEVMSATLDADAGDGAAGSAGAAGSGGATGTAGTGGSGGASGGAGGSVPDICPSPGCAPGQTCMGGYCYGAGRCAARTDVICRVVDNGLQAPCSDQCIVASDGTGRMQNGVPCSCMFNYSGLVVSCDPGTVCR